MNYRFTAYEALLHLREALSKFPNPDLLHEINALIAQVQDRKFIVAVAGEFNRGKSSLINALLGMAILPMDILPMTATATRVVYGLTPRARIQKKDGSELQININELADYVTKLTDESHQMAKTIRETVIEYPTILCQNGLEILDTPGLNDTEEMSKITKSILQEAHAVVFAVSAMMPLSMSEVDWLARMIESDQLQYLMFAVTFFDRVAERDHQKVLDTIRERISTMVQGRVCELYPDRPELLKKAKRLTTPETMFLMPVSSRDALDAFDLGDDELLQNSNLPQFKMMLTAALNAQQDEYVIRRASELLGQVEAWLQEANDQRSKLKEAQLLSQNCDDALQTLEKYTGDVRKSINQIYEMMEKLTGETPDAYNRMKEAANAVIDQHNGKIQTNDDVHSTLQEATVAAREAAKTYYLEQWQARCLKVFNQYIDQIQAEHEALLGKCCKLLEAVPQLNETESLRKELWRSMGACVLPELPETWSLDITGGVLKGLVSGGQKMAESFNKSMSAAISFIGKKSPGFRKSKEKFDEFMRKTGISEKIENIELPPMEIKEGTLIGRNLYDEIESKLSEGTTSLIIGWKKMPENLGPILHQVYLNNEALLTDTSLQLALVKRKGEADARITQYIQDYEERFESAKECMDKATADLKDVPLLA